MVPTLVQLHRVAAAEAQRASRPEAAAEHLLAAARVAARGGDRGAPLRVELRAACLASARSPDLQSNPARALELFDAAAAVAPLDAADAQARTAVAQAASQPRGR